MVPVFKNVGERSTAKNYCPVSLLSVVSKVFEKLLNNRIVDHLQKCGLFLISNMKSISKSSWSTADLLTVVSDRINRSGTTRASALDISKAWVFFQSFLSISIQAFSPFFIPVSYLGLKL